MSEREELMDPSGQEGMQSEPPPLFKTWGRFYSFVLGELVLLIILFYWFRMVFE
jgi:hypothetical protein